MIDVQDRAPASGVVGSRRRGRPYRAAALAALDALLVYCAFAVAYVARYDVRLGPRIQDHISFVSYQPVALLLLAVLLPALFVKGRYRYRMSSEMVDDLSAIASSSTIAVAAVVVITAMLHQYEYSRGVILYVWLLAIALLAAGDIGFRAVQSRLHRRGWGVRRLLVVGASNVGKMIMQSVTSRPDLGYQLAGFVDGPAASPLRSFGRFQSLGTLSDVPELLATGEIDEVILALPASAHEEIWNILSLAEQHGVGVKLVPDLFEVSLSRVKMDDIAGIPLLDMQEHALRRIELAAKRVLDLVVAIPAGVLMLPVVALLWVLIKLETPGPGFIAQRRVGKDGREFTCWKVRTMRPDAEALRVALESYNETDGPMFKIRNDPRCTPLGRRMRRLSLDELPQLWNVIRGEMSMVGPRPPLPSEVERYDPSHRRRLEVKPGMTGLWQVSGRSDLAFDEMVLMDTYYVDNWSVGLDLKILVRTAIAVLSRSGAY